MAIIGDFWAWIKDVCQDILSWLVGWIAPTIKAIGSFFKAVAAISLFVWGLLLTVLELVDVSAGLDSIADTFDSMASTVRSLPVAPIMSQLNVIFPVNEFLVLAGLLLAIYLLILAVRFAIFVVRLIVGLVQIVMSIVKKG
jgi:hypothetical protein